MRPRFVARSTASFDSTYEGLKRALSPPLPSGSDGFDSTYEGLKRTIAPSWPDLHSCFDSTYEGLKPTKSANGRNASKTFRQYL